ncbi:DUF4145 domain-containing protein [Pseudomonas sp. DSP3-2-2]|uniref:DUF4145 domain-containing protein n=1 Tax=unclassified Pseudomonas TaxID=196821 RepID=UPI003CF3A180
MTKLFRRRFDELERQLEEIAASKTTSVSQLTGTQAVYVDQNALLNWQIKAKTLLTGACGEGSHHVQSLQSARHTMMGSNYDVLKQMRAVFLAAKEDFEGGYLNTLRDLVHAEVFGSELEQASELLSSGYATAAAVIAGVVLETTIRNLCTDHGIDLGKLDKMNADLAKSGVYNSIQQKRITAMAGIRNAAAHGDADRFNPGDVKGMIDDVERFLALNLQ